MSLLSKVNLSLLDLVHIRSGFDAADAIANSVALARHVENLGFARFWLAEHHNLDGIASSATAVLAGHIAGHTSRIRVGSGGIMLPNHPPLVVAEQFGTLATLYPGRIDLGLGRAPGTDPDTMRALRRRPEDGEDFPEQVQQLQQLLGPAHHGQKLMAIPGTGTNVPIWLLGSSLFSAQLAAQLGLPYAFASHFAPRMLHEAVAIYKDRFRPSAVLAEPYLMLGVPAIVADTDREAEFLASTAQQKVLSLLRGDTRLLQPPVTDMDQRWLPHEQRGVEGFLGAAVIGGPARVAQQLEVLLARTGADELMVVSDIYDQGARHHSLSLLAGLVG
ncbi:LLM class flavin-dependent oxidoreductase [Zobellella endophytica]|uniref:Luciferase-like monooxygenase n=1 Tax=Zobellella endophytica TaxID=2116700 RepID=A0A2P7RB89_9GAMM|nr:LLM class flavin-dependent oxidoreductase [Zobellella endophytica]PSJ47469.1 LLM class flavin-dependent oxidoreductase [Zobellella endophytica]